jgi:hypothetical protein
MLKGRIDKNLEVKITLTLEDIEKLEKEKMLHGIMSKPVPPADKQKEDDDDDERHYDRRSIIIPRRVRRKGDNYLKLKPGESGLSFYLREFFKFEGLPANHPYWNRNSYDISINQAYLNLLREGQKIVKIEPVVPVNYLCISLEVVVKKPAEPIQQPGPEQPSQPQTQSL